MIENAEWGGQADAYDPFEDIFALTKELRAKAVIDPSRVYVTEPVAVGSRFINVCEVDQFGNPMGQTRQVEIHPAPRAIPVGSYSLNGLSAYRD